MDKNKFEDCIKFLSEKYETEEITMETRKSITGPNA